MSDPDSEIELLRTLVQGFKEALQSLKDREVLLYEAYQQGHITHSACIRDLRIVTSQRRAFLGQITSIVGTAPGKTLWGYLQED